MAIDAAAKATDSEPPQRAVASKLWRMPQHDPGEVQRLSDSRSIHPIVAQLLIQRGITQPDDIARFLHAKLTDLRPPEQLPGLSAAVEHIWDAIQNDKAIVVYGDYDADGMTATAILYGCLQLIGANVSYHLPNRMEEGYGLHVDSVEKLAARGKELLITVDCGIASIAAAERAAELGLTLIVTDHHRFGDALPIAAAIVHPALPGSDYPFAGLCGAGVAFKIAWALCQQHSGSVRVAAHLRDFLMRALGLAAIGTVADVVPLLDENRIIVRNGLKTLHSNPSVGLQQLIELNKMGDKSAFDSEDIAFTLAPRLNAAGRLGQAQLGVELLITEDKNRAEALATYIQELNSNRQTIERSITSAANKQLKETYNAETDSAIVLASPGWHPGVIGIVAGRLAEKHHKPVVIIAMDTSGEQPGSGSARSPNGVNLHKAIMQCDELLVTGGGHAAAAGLKIEDVNIAAFRAAFMEACDEQASEISTVDELVFDAEASLDQLDVAMIYQINALGPFGAENPRPAFYATDVTIANGPNPLGASGQHLSVQLGQYGKKMRAVNFGSAETWIPAMERHQGKIDVAFRPVINEFRGYPSAEVHLLDWRGSDSE